MNAERLPITLGDLLDLAKRYKLGNDVVLMANDGKYGRLFTEVTVHEGEDGGCPMFELD